MQHTQLAEAQNVHELRIKAHRTTVLTQKSMGQSIDALEVQKLHRNTTMQHTRLTEAQNVQELRIKAHRTTVLTPRSMGQSIDALEVQSDIGIQTSATRNTHNRSTEGARAAYQNSHNNETHITRKIT